MKGIDYYISDDFAYCYINYFSADLKEVIRNSLISVCHGADAEEMAYDIYSYHSTVKEFLKRYELKSEETKIGLVGELLAHTLITELFPSIEPVSPFFNLEERSIKKGFDVILYEEKSSSVWITEVKSGALHKDSNCDKTTRKLLNNSMRDLKKRLNENEEKYWLNAIVAARVAVSENSDYKDVIIDLLASEGDASVNKLATSSDNNAFLVSVLFHDTSSHFDSNIPEAYCAKVQAEKIFNSVFVFSLQKSTIAKVIDFLKSEAEDG